MKPLWHNVLFAIIAVAVVVGVVFLGRSRTNETLLVSEEASQEERQEEVLVPVEEIGEEELVTTVVEGLDVPWDIAFLPASPAGGPDGRFLVTERSGRLLVVGRDGTQTTVETDLGREAGEGGLLGLTLHPDFENNGLVYFYMTVSVGSKTENRVERHRFENNTLSDRRVIIDGIPGAAYHDGGRIAFGPPTSCASGQVDCMLYLTTSNRDGRGRVREGDDKIIRVNPALLP
ncbi:PQQ-dependent sugar dehydrogenase [Candidatus Wolfebacteria bacterium]|nr:PQQ-dependent sugar dehydrogenase [Candidatus Wolfebacteria bacterium]